MNLQQTSCLLLLKVVHHLGKLNGGGVAATFLLLLKVVHHLGKLNGGGVAATLS